MRLQSLQGRVCKRSYGFPWLPAVVKFDRQRSHYVNTTAQCWVCNGNSDYF